MCHRLLDPEDQGYHPVNYPDVLLCIDDGKEFRKWEAMEQNHRGHITVKICKCGCLLEAHFDHRKHFYDTKWTREKVIQEIRTSEKRGEIRLCKRKNRSLYEAAKRRFGNWRNAIRAAKSPIYQ